MTELISQREYARRIGVSHVAVGKLVKSGAITLVKGKIDPALADKQRAANCDPTKIIGRRTVKPLPKSPPDRDQEPDESDEPDEPAPEADSLNAEKLKGEKLKNKKRELDLASAEGKLVDKSATERAVFALSRSVRQHWLAWPSRVSAEMAAELGVEPAEMLRVLDDGIRTHLQELADPKRLKI